MATFRSTPAVPPEVITYRLGEKLVYVKPAADYEQGLDVAQKEFSEELYEVSRDRISFNISAPVNGERRPVRVSESAWPAAVARLLRGEVIDIQVRPLPRSADAKDQPPQYLELPDALDSSRQSYSSPPSPSSYAREPSPSRRSEKGTSRSWFGKF